jgi:hypothetical protein
MTDVLDDPTTIDTVYGPIAGGQGNIAMTDLPPTIGPSDELTTVETAYGPMAKWKARALSIGWFQQVINEVRADSKKTTPMTDEQKPPRLVADQQRSPAIDPELLSQIEDRIEQLTQRLDAYERRMAAQAALEALEDEVARLTPPEEGDDDRVIN